MSSIQQRNRARLKKLEAKPDRRMGNITSVDPLQVQIGGAKDRDGNAISVDAVAIDGWEPTVGLRVVIDTWPGNVLIVGPVTTAPAHPITPAELPDFLTDNTPPASSPDAIAVGSIRWVTVGWSAITNNDPVTYEVHASTSSGFTPGPTTLAGTTAATRFDVYQLQDGTPLALDTDYYFQIVARDDDGAASPGAEDSAQLVPINSPDIAAEAIYGDHIHGGEIDATKFATTLALVSLITTSTTGGRRWEGDPTGLRFYAQDESLLFSLPTDSSQAAQFRGDAELGDTIVTYDPATSKGKLTLQSPNNAIAAGGALKLDSIQGSPTTPPSLAITWDQLPLTGGVSGSGYGIAYAADGGASADADQAGGDPTPGTPCYYTARKSGVDSIAVEEYSASTGTLSRSANYSVGFIVDSVLGIAQYNDGGTRKLYLAFRTSGTTKVVLRIYTQSDLLLDAAAFLTSLLPASDATATLGRGPSGPLLVHHNAASSGNLRIRPLNPTTGADLGTSFTTSGYSYAYGSSLNLVGAAYDGSNYWISDFTLAGSYARRFNSSGVYQSNNDFRLGGGYATGLAYNGSVFVSADTGASPKVYTHTDWTWTTESAKYWIGYSWTDGTNETLVGPRQAIDMTGYRRAKLRITPAARPSGITANRIYAGRGSSDPGGTGSSGVQRQTTTSYIDSETATSALMKNFLAAGDDGPASNGFAASGSPAKIEPTGGTGYLATAGPTIKGTGEFRLPVMTTTQRGNL